MKFEEIKENVTVIKSIQGNTTEISHPPKIGLEETVLLRTSNYQDMQFSPVPVIDYECEKKEFEKEEPAQIDVKLDEVSPTKDVNEISLRPSRVQTFKEICTIKKKTVRKSTIDPVQTSQNVCSFIDCILAAIIGAAVNKVEKESNGAQDSPVEKLLDDLSPETHLYHHSIFHKEIVPPFVPRQSLLTIALKKVSEARKKESFLLPTVRPRDPQYQPLRVYLFDTPEYLDLQISKIHKVEEIIRHVITVLMDSDKFKHFFTGGGEARILSTPSLYELRLVEDDDEDEYYVPLYDISALDRGKPIGEFSTESLAFCRIKNYKIAVKELGGRPEPKPSQIQSLAVQKNLVALKIHYSIDGLSNIICLMVDKNMKLNEVLEKIGNRLGTYLSPGLYQFKVFTLSIPGQQQSVLRYTSFNNASYFDMNTAVLNLTSLDIQLVERLYGDQSSVGRRTLSFRQRSSTMAKSPIELEELKRVGTEHPACSDHKEEHEFIHNKYTASDYRQFEAKQKNARGVETKVLIIIDGVKVYSTKKVTNPLEKKNIFCEIPIKSVVQVERGLCEKRKIYIYYLDSKSKKQRFDFEMEKDSYAAEIITTLRYIIRLYQRDTVGQSKNLHVQNCEKISYTQIANKCINNLLHIL